MPLIPRQAVIYPVRWVFPVFMTPGGPAGPILAPYWPICSLSKTHFAIL